MLQTGRHAAPRARRALLLPTALLLSGGVAGSGLAAPPAAAAPTGAPSADTRSAATPSAVTPSRATAAVAAAAPGQRPAPVTSVHDDRLLQAWRTGSDDEQAARERTTRAAWTRAAEVAAQRRATALRASRARRPAPAAPTVARPGVGPLTSGFGPRWGRLHAGIDLAAGTGAPVSAAAAGVVRTAGVEGGYGNVVRVEHAQGTVTVYAHLSEVLVTPGQPVPVGALLGHEGSSGHSTGPHLHFEVRVGDVPVDPLVWLQQRGLSL